MEAIGNFRELGGLPVAGGTVRPGVLYRSGHLAHASDADGERLLELGIRTVIDLRAESDIAAEGQDQIPSAIAHHHVPIHDDAGRGADIRALVMRGELDEIRSVMGDGRGHAMATDGAAEFVRSTARMECFGRAMVLIADPDNWPVLWHCSAGKDRAGWIATSALLGVGAAVEVIVDHYVESNRRLAEGGGLDRWPDGEMKDLLRPFLEVHEDFVRAQLDVVAERWGDHSGLYRDGFGLTTDVIGRFTDALVVPG